MRLNYLIRLLTLLAFALFGGALPVVASGDHVVICGADGVERLVAYDFETGKPVDVEIAEPECQDCFGAAPLLVAQPDFPPFDTAKSSHLPHAKDRTSPKPPLGLPPARAPPSLII